MMKLLLLTEKRAIPCQDLYCLHPSQPQWCPLLARTVLSAVEEVESVHIHHPMKVQGVCVKVGFWCSRPTGGNHEE